MKITMFVTEDAVQFNLEPQNDHEKKFLKILQEYNGPVAIHQGMDVGLCSGGYVRNFGEGSRVLALTILKEPGDGNPT